VGELTAVVKASCVARPCHCEVCVELLSSRLSIDNLMLNTYSASGRRTVHHATIERLWRHCCFYQIIRKLY